MSTRAGAQGLVGESAESLKVVNVRQAQSMERFKSGAPFTQAGVPCSLAVSFSACVCPRMSARARERVFRSVLARVRVRLPVHAREGSCA